MSEESLYRQYAVAAPSGGPEPGTWETKQIETTDNDQGNLNLGLFGPSPSPGTRLAASVETVDNDVALAGVELHMAAPPHPPGTAITATIETMDNDIVLTHMNGRM